MGGSSSVLFMCPKLMQAVELKYTSLSCLLQFVCGNCRAMLNPLRFLRFAALRLLPQYPHRYVQQHALWLDPILDDIGNVPGIRLDIMSAGRSLLKSSAFISPLPTKHQIMSSRIRMR